MSQFAKLIGKSRTVLYHILNKPKAKRDTKYADLKLKTKLIAGRLLIPSSELDKFNLKNNIDSKLNP